MADSISYASAFAAGVVSFLSPCVLPIVPGYLGFITGMSLDELRMERSRWVVVVPALYFVAGFSLIFLLLGASATLVGQVVRVYQDWIARIGGVLLILFGLHLLDVVNISTLVRERRIHIRTRPAGNIGAFLAGLAFGAGWTPCLGPILGALLTLAMDRATLVDGMALLGSYALGLAVPFIAAAALTGHFIQASTTLRRMAPVMERVSGGILIVLGVLLVTGSFTVLSGWLARITPSFILENL